MTAAMTETLDLKVGDAAATLWLEGVPPVDEHRTASIGAFSCDDEASGRRLILAALETLSGRGYTYVIGPMDGDTWHSYRLVTEDDGTPPFFLEPQNPPFYPSVFADRGFRVIGCYSSAVTEDFTPRLKGDYGKRLERAGIIVRPFDKMRSMEELTAIHALSLHAFCNNFLYTPIDREAFFDLYKPLLPRIVPQFVQMAEDRSGNLLAFLFACPDYAQENEPDALIIKTYASLYPGLGGFLLDRLHQATAMAGYRRAVHALMHDNNLSRRNSDKNRTRTFRRYAVFGRELST